MFNECNKKIGKKEASIWKSYESNDPTMNRKDSDNFGSR